MKVALRSKHRRRIPPPAVIVSPPPPPPAPLLVPANTTLPAITGLLVVGSILTCSTGTWTNFPTSYAYQWFEGGSPVGTNANTYVSTVVGASIFCIVTASITGAGTGSATAAAVGPIVSVPILQTLTLSANSIAENSVAGTFVGTIQNATGGSALSLSDTAGSRFAISGGNVVTGSVATNYESATTHNITIVETLSGATGSPRSTTLAISVTNVFEQPDLGALTFSSNAFTAGSTSSGSIFGATATSTVTASGLPSGLTINGGARTWAWDGTGSVSSGTFPLTETLADSSNSPRVSTIGYTISAAGAFATPTLTNFSALGAAPMVLMGSTADYVAGYRGQLQIATDNAFTVITQNQIFFIDGASWANDSVATGINTPTGTFYARWRVVRDNESSTTVVTGNDPKANALSFNADISPWSNTYTDTINVPSAVWNTTTGANKSNFVSISGSNLVVTGTATVGAPCGVRSATSTTGQRQFEVTWTTKPGSPTPDSMLMGVEAGTTTLGPSTFPVPNPGVIYKGDGHIYKNGAVVQSGVATCAQGDTVTCEFDTGAGTVGFYKNGTQIGTTVTGISFSNYYGYCGTLQADVLTANFGQNAWVHTPNTGYAGW